MPLILQHPGWGMTASTEERGAGIQAFAEAEGFISVTPQGMGDNQNSGGPWYSWNAVGTTQSPGPAGPTCTSAANYPSYCYDSCQKCKDKPQCDWTTCDETVTPTGTGRANVGGFIPGLYDTLESQLCIDTTREYAAGESNGGMMTYQLGVDLASRLAAIAPQFGSFHKGFAMAPLVGVPVIDTHGNKDTTVPGGVSLSGDGYYYTTTDEIFNGGKYSSGWKKANGCSGSSSTYKTKYDGIKNLKCTLEGSCSGGDVVKCIYDGGHNWFNNGGSDNGGLVTDFLLKWKKSSHIGGGRSKGEELGAGPLLSNITVLDHAEEDALVAADLNWQEDHIEAVGKAHYGDPANGCLDDEDVVLVGTGRSCSHKVALAHSDAALPSPKCSLGGVAAHANGCPVDASYSGHTASWPICMAKSNLTDPYSNGDFHCLLVCPCELGAKGAGECGHESHKHCPVGAKCERGELRKRDQGVCTYAIKDSAIVV